MLKTQKIKLKKRDSPKWRFDVTSMTTGEVIWTYNAFKIDDIPKKWKNDTGNSWLSRAKVVRACTGELNCQFIKCYKINQWASRSIELEREPPKFSPSSPTNSEFSTLDDYSTCEETEGESDE